jgi:hypothetical protein
MKYLAIILTLTLAISCGKSKKETQEIVTGIDSVKEATEIVEKISYPQANQATYGGEVIADLNNNSAVVSSYGSVAKGTTLNVLTIKGREFLVYGEDGVFATECEIDSDFPTHGPGHPRCQTAHAESFDKIIICTSTKGSEPILIAQNWPGVDAAMANSNLGMVCWVTGAKMSSSKIFTY